MRIRYDTYCGLNCGACPVGIANQQEDGELIGRMAEEWCRDPDDLSCHGCKTQVTAAFCTDCRMRACASKQGLDFCSQCEDFPCGILNRFRNDEAPHHSAVLKNLSRIEELGVETWLEEEAVRWSCRECGTRFGWYSEECPECGARLYNSILEEKELEI
jgi:hypothetical protein